MESTCERNVLSECFLCILASLVSGQRLEGRVSYTEAQLTEPSGGRGGMREGQTRGEERGDGG